MIRSFLESLKMHIDSIETTLPQLKKRDVSMKAQQIWPLRDETF